MQFCAHFHAPMNISAQNFRAEPPPVRGNTRAAPTRYAQPVSVPATGLVARLRDRFGHLVHEVGKFGVVGAATYVVDLGTFNALRDVVGSMWAKVIATAIAATLAFAGNSLWTWRHRNHAKLHRAYALYFLFNAIGLGISLACLWISREVLGAQWPEVFRTRLADNVSAMVVGITLGTVFRFWSYRTFVFIARDEEPVAEPVAETAWKG
jgi:putative flippase GtrA